MNSNDSGASDGDEKSSPKQLAAVTMEEVLSFGHEEC